MGQGEVSESQVDGRTIGELQVKTGMLCAIDLCGMPEG